MVGGTFITVKGTKYACNLNCQKRQNHAKEGGGGFAYWPEVGYTTKQYIDAIKTL